ncbi:hypothetical protein OAI26_06455 [Sulfitobacter sp.]|nr:hypothetical protein [Sulfitobacter sp.]
MKNLVRFITATAFACGIPIFADAASFNCAKASTANEIAICSDDELSTLDETLAAVYKQARGSVSDAKRLKGEQVNWIKSLGTCDGNVDCLISAYRSRILVLDYLDGQVAVTLDPLQAQVAQLNQREEILAQRENALTTELRALNAEIERFEEEKLAFANTKDSNSAVEQTNSQSSETAGNKSCQLAETSLGEQISLTKCVAYTNQAVKAFGQEPVYVGDYNDFWEVDKECNYLPSLISQTKEGHEEIGKASAASRVLEQNVNALTNTIDACNILIESHFE